MLLLTYAGHTLRVDDEAGEALLDYAGALATAGEWDTVELAMRTAADDTVEATIVVGAGVPAPCMVRSREHEVPDTDNAAEVQRLRTRTRRYTVGVDAHVVPITCDDYDL